MSIYAGKWLSGTPGDTTKILRLPVLDQDGVAWGTAVSTGWTPTLECRLPDDTGLTATLTGTWEDTNEAAALFTVGAESSLVPAPTTPATPNVAAEYECVLVLTKSGVTARIGADEDCTPFRIRVQAWP